MDSIDFDNDELLSFEEFCDYHLEKNGLIDKREKKTKQMDEQMI